MPLPTKAQLDQIKAKAIKAEDYNALRDANDLIEQGHYAEAELEAGLRGLDPMKAAIDRSGEKSKAASQTLGGFPKLRAALGSVAAGGAHGGLDELTGAAGAAVGAATGNDAINYESSRDYMRAQRDGEQEQLGMPADLALQTAGAMMLSRKPGSGWKSAARQGAVHGGVAGGLSADGDLADRAVGAGLGLITGGAAGAVGHGISQALGKRLDAATRWVQNKAASPKALQRIATAADDGAALADGFLPTSAVRALKTTKERAAAAAAFVMRAREKALQADLPGPDDFVNKNALGSMGKELKLDRFTASAKKLLGADARAFFNYLDDISAAAGRESPTRIPIGMLGKGTGVGGKIGASVPIPFTGSGLPSIPQGVRSVMNPPGVAQQALGQMGGGAGAAVGGAVGGSMPAEVSSNALKQFYNGVWGG